MASILFSQQGKNNSVCTPSFCTFLHRRKIIFHNALAHARSIQLIWHHEGWLHSHVLWLTLQCLSYIILTNPSYPFDYVLCNNKKRAHWVVVTSTTTYSIMFFTFCFEIVLSHKNISIYKRFDFPRQVANISVICYAIIVVWKLNHNNHKV